MTTWQKMPVIVSASRSTDIPAFYGVPDEIRALMKDHTAVVMRKFLRRMVISSPSAERFMV